MSSAPVFLHIGLPKTGTTSIQHFLSRNRPALGARGFVLPVTPGDPNHHKVTIHALDYDSKLPIRRVYGLANSVALDDFRARFLHDLREEAAAWSAEQAIILTGEHMSRLTGPAEFDRLKQLLAIMGQRPVRVVVYLRRQDLYCLSDYAQRIKNGESTPWQMLPEDASRPRFDYEMILGHWAAAFGRDNVRVRIYEAGQMEGGDLITDFLAAIGCPHGPDFRAAVRKNESLDAKTLGFLALINPWYPRFRDGRLNPDRKDMVAAVQQLAGGPGLRFAPAQAEAFLDRFQEGNARIARGYLGRADGRLSFERPADEPERPPQLDLEDAGEIAAHLWAIARGIDLPPANKRIRRAGASFSKAD